MNRGTGGRARWLIVPAAIACGPAVPLESSSTEPAMDTGAASASAAVTSDTGDRVSDSDDTGSDDAASDAASGSTGNDDEPRPLRPDCRDGFTCGDGITDPGEDCDDANADDEDGCTAECRRPAATASPPIAIDWPISAAVDVDGSVVVVGGIPPTINRLGADGETLWSHPLDLPPGTSVVRVNVLLGSQIVLVGFDIEHFIGIVWRYEPDGTLVMLEPDSQERAYYGADLAGDGDLVVLAGEDSEIERYAPDGTLESSVVPDIDASIGFSVLAVASDDSVFAAGGIAGLGEAAVIRITTESTTSLVLSPPDFPNAYLYNIAAMPDGGAVASGVTSGNYPVVVRVDADSGLLWTSACSDRHVRPGTVKVIDDHIVLGGYRFNPDCNSWPCNAPTHLLWTQHFAFDGTVLATDGPPALVRNGELWSETVRAVGRHPDGSIVALAQAEGSSPVAVFVARLPW